MPSDKKWTRSTIKTEEKTAIEEVPLRDKMEGIAVNKNNSAFDMFSNEEFLSRFADMVSKRINSTLEALISNLESK